jgi:hypothetical protein
VAPVSLKALETLRPCSDGKAVQAAHNWRQNSME